MYFRQQTASGEHGFPEKGLHCARIAKISPVSMNSWNGPRNSHHTAQGSKAVIRKQPAVFKVCWAIARATQAWPHTTTLYVLRLIKSQSKNNNGPHGGLHQPPDHMGKHRLMSTSGFCCRKAAKHCLLQNLPMPWVVFLEMYTISMCFT